MKKLYVYLLAISVFIFAGAGVIAQENQGTANGFKVSPVRAEAVVNPGKSKTEIITVTNVNDYPVDARAIVNDFEPADDETGNPRVLFDENTATVGNSFKSIVGDIDDVKIEANGSAEVEVPIIVSADASAGGYYGVVRFVSADGNGNFDENVALSASVGTIFLVTVPGDITEGLEMVELTAAKNGSEGRFFIGGSDDIEVVTRLKNTGNVHVQPYGKVSITDRSGNEVEAYEFNDDGAKASVLPDSIRKFTDEIEYNEFFGKYTITTNLGYGSGGNLISAKTTFWVIPVWLLIVAIVALIVIVIGAILIYKKVRQTRKHKVKPRR